MSLDSFSPTTFSFPPFSPATASSLNRLELSSTRSQLPSSASEKALVRFKKNLCLFFRALHFFEDFHGHRNFSQPKGFWGLIQQETRFLFEKPTGPVTFLWFLIEARETYGNTHPYTAIPDSHFPQYIHRLVFHWSSAIRQSREPDSRQKQSVDAKRLAERCAEWRMLLQTRQLAVRADMSDILSESQNIGAIFPHTAHLEGALHTTPHRMRAGATDPLFKQEHADEANGTNSPIGDARKRRRRSQDPDSHQGDAPDFNRREKRRRHASPEPDNHQTTPNPNASSHSPDNLSPRNDGRLAGLDKRLSHAISLQLEHGIDITNLDSRLQSQTNQLGAITATTNRLSETVHSNRANISALEEKVDDLALEERVTHVAGKKLMKTVVEALRSDLRTELDAQLDDLVNTAISRVDIGDRVRAAVSGIDIAGLVQTAVSRIPLSDLIQDAVCRVTIDDEIPRRLEAIEHQLKSHRDHRIASPIRLAHRPQQAAPPAPAQDFNSQTAREGRILRTMAEKIEKLEAELGKAKAVGPPATPSRPSQPQPGGRASSPIKLEDSA